MTVHVHYKIHYLYPSIIYQIVGGTETHRPKVKSAALYGSVLTEVITLTTKLGQLTGSTVSLNGVSVWRFLGIPYAKPPVGDLRFAKPQPYGNFNNLDATNYGSTCSQLTSFPNPKVKGSEDCLFLNIFVPDTVGKKPVLVWIHGGSFLSGSSSESPGDSLAAYGDVIVVTINYRLNIFGFLSTGDDRFPGNYGLWDQKLAIEWVKRNIEEYGGDSDRITLFGLSAGGRAITFQMFSPKNNASLFQKAITQSGSALSITFMNRDPMPVVKNITSALGCDPSNQDFVTCLKSKTTADLANSMQFTNRPFPFYPVVDGDFLPYDLGHLLGEFTKHGFSSDVQKMMGNFASYDLLSGWNSQEGLIYSSRIKSNDVSKGISRDVLTNSLSVYPFYNYGENDVKTKEFIIDLLIDYYMKSVRPLNSDGRSVEDKQLELYIEIAGDVVLKLPTIQHLQLHSATSSKNTFAYEFDHKRVSSPKLWNQGPDWLRSGADHAEETPYVFGYPLLTEAECTNISLPKPWCEHSNYTNEEKELSRKIVKQWVNFARHGNPSVDEYTTFDYPRNQSYTVLRTGAFKRSNYPLNDRQRLWSSIDAAVIEASKTQSVDTTLSPTTVAANDTCAAIKASYLNGIVSLTPEEANKYLTGTLVVAVLLAAVAIILVLSLIIAKFQINRKAK